MKLNAIINISKDNSFMKSKKTKEEQIIFGKTVLELVKENVEIYDYIYNLEDINSEFDNVLFLMGNGPVLDNKFISSNIEKNTLTIFKDKSGKCFAVYIPKEDIKENLDIIKSDWDLISDLIEKFEKVAEVINYDKDVIIETKLDLQKLTKMFQKNINDKITEKGGTILDSNSTYIDFSVKVGMDTIIYPNTFLKGNTEIGEDCIIGPDARIDNTKVGNNTTIKDSTTLDSEIANNTSVGPYAYIRPNSKIGSEVKVGDFVEIKNANIGDGTKISHLSYVGDADLGDNINIGCGVVFVNYNGKEKNRSIVGNNTFIGCNSNIVAPVTLGEMSYVAAGTTVTKNVPSKALAVARIRQSNKEGWVERRKLIKSK